ncbi:hypothetical protein BDY19DRAFT_989200 [Irpex rosettiformis]|uniref:Uncharacterized protein n=1 Tax=Irpex rosettiformis TaxID=378272 RepID=A0ACB8UH79_9APHY|nr:hypothetical protein BDY19DRAFT_989200 [Irpex rosettiformis]
MSGVPVAFPSTVAGGYDVVSDALVSLHHLRRPSSLVLSSTSSLSDVEKMLAAAFKSLQPVSRQNIRGVFRDLSKPTNMLAMRSYYIPPQKTNTPQRLGPGRLAKESDIEPDPESYWKAREEDTVKRLPPAPTKYQGRTIPVIGSDLGRAFDRLNTMMRQNNVSREVFRQDRHEKKGYKRRRLRSERWRRRFAHEVRKKVQLVNEIRARGA